ncbi:MAG: SusC/RagA family TonB-linked outer membrane protein [Ferruginibacter sp.]
MRKTTQKISKILSVALLFMLSAFSALAQNVISGNVTDSKNGNAVPNVTVTVKGTRVSVQTGNDGSFRITAPANARTLVFSSVGYAPQEADINGSNAVRISLVQSDQKLDEIVVVAYGTRKKTDLTGAVTQVSAKDFQKGNINSSEQLLQGKVAGLSVTTGGGSAGGGSTIRIRGGASINASNDPLIVIDGVPVESNGIAGSANYLNTINPDDIESISVLKDASATALYGSRASNGVLIITTKKGGRGKARYNFNTQVSLSRISNNSYVDVFSADELRNIINTQAAATGSNTYKNQLGNANTDWQKQIYRNAYSNNSSLSISGSMNTKNISIPYRVSFGYLYQEGILLTNKFDRFSTAVNLSPKFLNDHLAVNVNFKYSHTQNRFVNEGAVGSAVAMDPTQYVLNNDPKTGGYFEWNSGGAPIALANRNPVALLNLRDNTSRVNRIIGNVQLDYKLHFLPDLHLQANLGLDNAGGIGNDVIDSSLATDYLTKGKYTHYEQKKRNYIAEVSLFYEKSLGKGTKIDILALHGYQDFYTDVVNFSSYGLDGKLIESTIPTFPNDKPEYRLDSYLGRLNLTLFDKFLLSGSIRRDQTSKFSKDNRVGYFPAGAAALKLKEIFFKNSNLVSELKVRFSMGVTGQQDGIDYYYFQPIYYIGNVSAKYQFGNVFVNTSRPSNYNADLKWEQTTTTNIGLDFGLFKNRLSGSVEVYQKKTKDLLFTVPIALGAGFGIDQLRNVGNVENKGAELTVNTGIVRKRNFSWDLGFNVTYNEAKVKKLYAAGPGFVGTDVSGISGGTGNYIGKLAVGYAPFAYYVFKQVYDPSSGKPIEGLYEDINRDGKVDNNDRYLYKQPNADFFYGLNTVITIKKFSLGLAGHGAVGNYLYNNYISGNGVLNSIERQNPITTNNGSKNYLETGFKNNQYLSDYYIENASFFRLDNINLGYNFGNVLRNKTSLRVSASVQNVFVITKYSGTDPEISGNTGVDNNIYPRPRIYSIGANIDF